MKCIRTRRYDKCATAKGVELVKYDFNAEVRSKKKLFKAEEFVDRELTSLMRAHGFCLAIDNKLAAQTGLVRTSCLDCLDRTNAIQGMIGKRILTAMLLAVEVS